MPDMAHTPADLVRVSVSYRVECSGWFAISRAEWEGMSSAERQSRLDDFIGGDLYLQVLPAEPGDRAGDQRYDGDDNDDDE